MIIRPRQQLSRHTNLSVFFEMGDRFIMFYRGKVVFDGTRLDFEQNQNEYLKQYMGSLREGPMHII